MALFHPGALVAPIAVTCLQYVSLGYPFYAWGMVMEQSFNGAGDTATPTWINFGCYWCVQIPLAWYLASSSARAECTSRSAAPNRCWP